MAQINGAICRARSHQQGELGQNHHQSLEEHARLLEYTKWLISTLASHSMIARSCSSVLWHIDLHLGNILVSNDDSTIVEASSIGSPVPLLLCFFNVASPRFSSHQKIM